MSIFGNGLYNYRDNYIVNEAYVGKTKTLMEIEEQIGKIRENLGFFKSINSSKEVLTLNRLLEKQFGPDIAAVKIYNSNSPNAYTMVIGKRFDIAENVKMSDMVMADKQNGYKFVPNNNFVLLVNIAYGLIADPQYTDAEIVAVILHEIGHNFADCIYDRIDIANKSMMNRLKQIILESRLALIFSIIGIPMAIKYQGYLRTFNNQRQNDKEKKAQSKKPSFIKGIINGMVGKCKDLRSFTNAVVARLFGKSDLMAAKRAMEIKGAKQAARKSLDRQNEVIADKFAGVYGYGPDQASALIKLEGTPSSAEKFVNKLGGFGRKANEAYNDLIRDICDYDCHPQVIQRINEEIKLLENEIKKEDIDPKVKNAIQDQLNQLRRIIAENIKSNDKFSKDKNAQMIYNAYINNECPDAVDQEIEDAIENALNDVLDNGKRTVSESVLMEYSGNHELNEEYRRALDGMVEYMNYLLNVTQRMITFANNTLEIVDKYVKIIKQKPSVDYLVKIDQELEKLIIDFNRSMNDPDFKTTCQHNYTRFQSYRDLSKKFSIKYSDITMEMKKEYDSKFAIIEKAIRDCCIDWIAFNDYDKPKCFVAISDDFEFMKTINYDISVSILKREINPILNCVYNNIAYTVGGAQWIRWSLGIEKENKFMYRFIQKLFKSKPKNSGERFNYGLKESTVEDIVYEVSEEDLANYTESCMYIR